jgi:hypothetical protein
VRTPAGSECPFYFEDFHRGRQKQECRLLPASAQRAWSPNLCARCSVPRIVLANACPHLVLEARVAAGPLGIGRRMQVSASCTRSLTGVREPEIGCGHCHEPEIPSPRSSP